LQDDLGPVVNEKMRALNWTAEQYDNFFNHLHSEMSRDALVDALVEFAPPDNRKRTRRDFLKTTKKWGQSKNG
jgi:hypothetical protein